MTVSDLHVLLKFFCIEINKNKEFLDIASKAIMNYYESIMPIKDFDDLKKIKIEPFNLEEAAVSIMSDIRKTGCYTTYDFLADIKYYVDNTQYFGKFLPIN